MLGPLKADIATNEPDASRPPAPVPELPDGALARKFVSLLLDDAGKFLTGIAALSSTSTSKHDFTALDDFLSEIPEVEEEGATEVTLTVEEAVAAIQLAAGFESDPPLLRAVRREAPVIVVQPPDARAVTAFERVLHICAFGRGTSMVSMSALEGMSRSVQEKTDRRYAVILNCDGGKAARTDTEDRAMTALSLGIPVCALSLEPLRAVPAVVRSMADGSIAPTGWNAGSLSLLVEAVTGTPIAIAPEPWMERVKLEDVRTSVSKRRGAEGSLERLRQSVLKRTAKADELPAVESLSGYGKAQEIAGELLKDLRDYRDGRIPWSAIPRGLVLSGPTGVGKTFFVRCFAKSAGLPLVLGSMASWQSHRDGHLGDMLAAMRRDFADARAQAPSILFIDEADSIGDRKTFHHRHRDYSSQVVNALLEELDGASERSGVIVFAATNHVGRIDEAILRPGRLDRVVEIEMPDTPELVGIMRTQLGTDLADVDLLPVALAGRGGSGADVASWVRRARGTARRAERPLTVRDLLDAVREDRFVVPENERPRIAIHEAAHACAAIALDIGTVHGISLHDTGGTTVIQPAIRTTTRREAVNLIVHLLAGRAAESAFLGSVSAGAGGSPTSDLALATKTAFSLEASWGLGDLGPMWLGEVIDDAASFARIPALAAAVRRLLVHCEAEAQRLVMSNAGPIRRVAEALQDAGYLDAATVLDMLDDVPRFRVATGIDEPHPDLSAD